MLEIRLLGQFDIRREGEALHLASRPAQSLFAYLILNPETYHRRERLAGLLWPVSTESNARNNLRQALWRIRRMLKESAGREEDFLLVDNYAIRFNEEANYWLDVNEILKDPPHEPSVEHLEGIAELYKGDLLPGFYEDWVILERAKVQALYRSKLQLLLNKFAKEHRWGDLVDWSERWIAQGETPEPAYRYLMLAYHHQGDSSSVATTYERCTNDLVEQLGVNVSEETESLFQELSQGVSPQESEPGSQQSAESIPLEKQPFRSPGFPDVDFDQIEVVKPIFVGREDQLRELTEHLDHALAGDGRVVFVTGESGIGKSALLRYFSSSTMLQHDGHLTLWGNCNALTGTGDPYLPLRSISNVLCGDFEGKWASGIQNQAQVFRVWEFFPQAIDLLLLNSPELIGSFISTSSLMKNSHIRSPEREDWLASIEAHVSRSASRQAWPEFRPEDLHQQYVSWLLSISQHKPLLLILDDLQWADIGSIDLLFHLGREIQDNPLLIVCALRLSEFQDTSDARMVAIEKMLAEFKRIYGDIHIDLDQIGEQESKQFIEEYLDTEPNKLDSSFRDDLFRHTGGHPLFTIELLRALEARGDIQFDQTQKWIDNPSLDWRKLPAKIEGVVEERISGLGSDLMDLLTLASVEGDEFTAEVLSIILERDILDTITKLSGQLDKRYRIVTAEGSHRLDGQRLSIYRFRHILFQRHLYSQLDSIERAYHHERIGDTLEALYGINTDQIALQLAHQYSQAGIAEKAVNYLKIASDQARRLSAYNESIGLIKEAISYLPQVPEGGGKRRLELSLQTSLGMSLAATTGFAAPEVEQAYLRARTLCTEVGKPPQLFPILYGLRTYSLVRAEYRDSKNLATQLLQIAHHQESEEFILEASQAMGASSFYLGELKESKEHLEHGVALYRIEAHHNHADRFGQDPCVTCLSYLAFIAWSDGKTAQAQDLCLEAISLAEQVAHPFTMGLAFSFATILYHLTGKQEQALTFSESAIALAGKYHFPLWGAAGSFIKGSIQAIDDPQTGIEQMQHSLTTWENQGSRLGLSQYLGMLADAMGRSGALEHGLEVIEEALTRCSEAEEKVFKPELLRIKGDLLLKSQEDVREVEACYHEAIQLSKAMDIAPFMLRAALHLYELLRDTSRRSEAERELRRISRIVDQDSDLVELVQAKSILS